MTVLSSDLPPFRRADGPDKVTGSGRYTADLSVTGMAYAKLCFAKVAHGRIRRLDVTAARELAGVFAVITADDVPDLLYSPVIPDRRLFARDVVRFEGEVLAAVAAVDAETAERAVSLIDVEIEPLPVVNDLEAALKEDSPLVHEDWESYEATGDTPRDRNVATFSSITKGDAASAMDTADVVVSSRYVADGSHAVPIEPRSVLAQWEGDAVTIWTSSQVPFEARAGVCETLQLPTNRVRVIVPHLGGGFGGKCGFHFEAHVAALAKAAKRPAKLVFSREEEFLAPDRRRESMIVELTTGVTNDGEIVARQGRVLIDNGAYVADAAFFPQLAAMHVGGPYRIPAIELEASLVYTNHQPSGSVRAPTAPQACWAVESHTDELADAVGLDPVEFRRRNIVHTGDEGFAGQVYGEIGLDECLERAAASLAASVAEVPLGSHEATGVAVSWWPSFGVPAGANVKMQEDGSVQIITGAQECGTGAVMTLADIAADELGVEPSDIRIVYQDTAVAPTGPGATGSQTLLNHGRAVEAASRQIADQLRELAAAELEAAAGDIVLADGQAGVAGSPGASLAIADLAASAAQADLLLGSASAPVPEYPTVSAVCVGDQGMAAWLAPQFSCHAVRVAVDPDTGVSRVLEVHAAHDSGTILNPIGAHGQVEGGIVMGIGQALTEGTQLGEGLQRNAGLLEYKLQTIADVPTISTQFVEIDTPNAGPRGSKGLAEAPNVATAAAIANAIRGVIGSSVRTLPMTAERVWSTIEEARV